MDHCAGPHALGFCDNSYHIKFTRNVKLWFGANWQQYAQLRTKVLVYHGTSQNQAHKLNSGPASWRTINDLCPVHGGVWAEYGFLSLPWCLVGLLLVDTGG